MVWERRALWSRHVLLLDTLWLRSDQPGLSLGLYLRSRLPLSIRCLGWAPLQGGARGCGALKSRLMLGLVTHGAFSTLSPPQVGNSSRAWVAQPTLVLQDWQNDAIKTVICRSASAMLSPSLTRSPLALHKETPP